MTPGMDAIAAHQDRQARRTIERTIHAHQAVARWLTPELLTQAITTAHTWRHGPQAAAYDSPKVTSTADGSPPPPGFNTATGHGERDYIAELDEAVMMYRNGADRIIRLMVDLVHHRPNEGRPTTAGQGHCICCDRYCPGTPTDRLKGGLCNSCGVAVYRLRAERPDLDQHGRVNEHRRRLTAQRIAS